MYLIQLSIAFDILSISNEKSSTSNEKLSICIKNLGPSQGSSIYKE